MGQKIILCFGKDQLPPICPVWPQLPAQPGPKTGLPRVYCGPFVLIGSMNPCPCGYYGDPVQECTCSNAMVTHYQKRISGPLRDCRTCTATRLSIHANPERVR